MVKETKNVSKKTNVKKDVKKVATKKKEVSKKVEKKPSIFKRIGNWFRSVFKEVSKVKWPSKKEMVKYSVATIVFVIFFSLFFYVIELLMAFVKSLI